MKLLLLIIPIFTLTGCYYTSGNFNEFIGMSPTDFSNCTTVSTYDLDDIVSIDTEKCYNDNKTLERYRSGSDIYFGSKKNKITGQTQYSVFFTFYSNIARRPISLNYDIDGIQSRPSEYQDSSLNCSGGSCTVGELYKFIIPNNDVLAIINDKNTLWWDVLIKNRRIGHVDWKINKNELVGLYNFTENY